MSKKPDKASGTFLDAARALNAARPLPCEADDSTGPVDMEFAFEPAIAGLEAALNEGDCDYLAENMAALEWIIDLLQEKAANIAALHDRAVRIREACGVMATPGPKGFAGAIAGRFWLAPGLEILN